jgi:hypothetical protein
MSGPATARPRPLRRDLFADPSARLVWAAISELDVAQQHEVYRQLGAELAVPAGDKSPHGHRVAWAVGALREAVDLLEAEGKVPQLGVEAYRRLRREHPERDFPADSSVRRWFGASWNDALRRAELKPVPEGDALVQALGSSFTRQECLQALKECAADTGNSVPGVWNYANWAKRPDVRARPGRRPLSTAPVLRIFGGWRPALEVAGLIRAATSDGANDSETGLASSPDKVRPSAGYAYSEGELQAALREVAERLGRSPTRDEYGAERAAILAEEKKAGLLPRPFPSFTAHRNHHRRWDESLMAAGLAARNGSQVKNVGHRRRHRFTREEIRRALEEAATAAADAGLSFTAKFYDEWRKEQRARDLAAQRDFSLPSYLTILDRFGGWKKAVGQLLGQAPPDESASDDRGLGNQR